MKNKNLLDKTNLVVNNLINMGGADYESDNLLSVEEILKSGDCKRDFGIEEWDWPQGVGIYGIYKLQEYFGDNRYMDFLTNWFDSNLEKGLPSRNINTTAPFLTLINILDKMPNQEKYEKLCISHADWIMNGLPRTKEDGFQHVTTGIGDRNSVILNDSEMWVDTIFMAVLFLYKMGVKYDNVKWRDEAEYQVLMHLKYLNDKNSGLFFHGWSFNRNDNFGEVFWCRGNSWYTIGVTEFIITNPKINGALKKFLLSNLEKQLNSLISLQSDEGLWNTILNDKTTYLESSGSAGIVAGIMNGINNGLIGDSYKKCANKAIDALLGCICEDGSVDKVSAGTAMGMDSEHYKNIQINKMAYGQALTLIALSEALKNTKK